MSTPIFCSLTFFSKSLGIIDTEGKIIIIIIIITDLYSAFKSEGTEALEAAQEE